MRATRKLILPLSVACSSVYVCRCHSNSILLMHCSSTLLMQLVKTALENYSSRFAAPTHFIRTEIPDFSLCQWYSIKSRGPRLLTVLLRIVPLYLQCY